MRRKIIYSLIYVGIAISFPSLPLQGVVFIKNLFKGGMVAAKDGAIEEGKEMIDDMKHDFLDSFNPFD